MRVLAGRSGFFCAATTDNGGRLAASLNNARGMRRALRIHALLHELGRERDAVGFLRVGVVQDSSAAGERERPSLDGDKLQNRERPVLDAFPDAIFILVSGLGGSQAEAQEEVMVGMGLVAGSSVLQFTALWGLFLVGYRCDLVQHPTSGELVAKDRTLTKGFHLSGTGITVHLETKYTCWIMVATLLLYIVAQAPLLLGLNTKGHLFIGFAAVISVLGLVAYCMYQIWSPWIQEMRVTLAKYRYRRNHALHKLSHLVREQNWGSLATADGNPNEEVLTKLFGHFDENGDGRLTEAELKGLVLDVGIERHNGQCPGQEELKQWIAEFDTSGDKEIDREEFLEGMKRWMKTTSSSEHHRWDSNAQNAKLDLVSLEEELSADEGEEAQQPEDETRIHAPSKPQIIAQGVGYLVSGAALSALFTEPLVQAIDGFSKASGIAKFFVSFDAAPLATTHGGVPFFISFAAIPLGKFFGESVSSLSFASSPESKSRRNASIIYSRRYGAVTMNNTMSFGVFLILVYARGLQWNFSAEVSVILFATLTMGSLAGVRTTYPLWMALVGLALYPASIGLVAFLDYVCGWH